MLPQASPSPSRGGQRASQLVPELMRANQYWVTDPDGNRIELMEIKPESPHAAADARWTTAAAAH